MAFTKTISETETGFEYRIFMDDQLVVYQPFHPKLPGQYIQTAAEAETLADEVIQQYTNPSEIQLPPPPPPPTQEERIAQLEAEKAALEARVAQAEEDTLVALEGVAQVYEMIIGGTV